MNLRGVCEDGNYTLICICSRPVSRLVAYLRALSTGRLILWCYFIWYGVVLAHYFEPSLRLWLTSLGLSAIIGAALYISTTALFGPNFFCGMGTIGKAARRSQHVRPCCRRNIEHPYPNVERRRKNERANRIGGATGPGSLGPERQYHRTHGRVRTSERRGHWRARKKIGRLAPRMGTGTVVKRLVEPQGETWTKKPETPACAPRAWASGPHTCRLLADR